MNDSFKPITSESRQSDFVNLFNIFTQFKAFIFVVSGIDFLTLFRYHMFSKEGSIMTDQELLDMFIQERINMLIDVFHKNQPDKSKQEEEMILQTEIFIENLPCTEKELVENYIDSLISQLALEEAFLYRHGFMEGIKVFKYIDKL